MKTMINAIYGIKISDPNDPVSHCRVFAIVDRDEDAHAWILALISY